jgi:hypothetical protein
MLGFLIWLSLVSEICYPQTTNTIRVITRVGEIEHDPLMLGAQQSESARLLQWRMTDSASAASIALRQQLLLTDLHIR